MTKAHGITGGKKPNSNMEALQVTVKLCSQDPVFIEGNSYIAARDHEQGYLMMWLSPSQKR